METLVAPETLGVAIPQPSLSNVLLNGLKAKARHVNYRNFVMPRIDFFNVNRKAMMRTADSFQLPGDSSVDVDADIMSSLLERAAGLRIYLIVMPNILGMYEISMVLRSVDASNREMKEWSVKRGIGNVTPGLTQANLLLRNYANFSVSSPGLIDIDIPEHETFPADKVKKLLAISGVVKIRIYIGADNSFVIPTPLLRIMLVPVRWETDHEVEVEKISSSTAGIDERDDNLTEDAPLEDAQRHPSIAGTL
jgi:hypothetical protein